MRINLITSPALTSEQLQQLLTPAEFEQLLGAVKLGQQLFDKAEDRLLIASFAQWSPEELERRVGFGQPEPEVPAASDFDRLREILGALCKPGEPNE